MEKLTTADSQWPYGRANKMYLPSASRKIPRNLAGALVVVMSLGLLWSYSLQLHPQTALSNDHYLQGSDFISLQLNGFVNTGKPGKLRCDDLRHEGELQVQQSFHLDDDLLQIAYELRKHPMVAYSEQDPTLSHDQVVKRSWSRLSGSSVWLDKYQVYLTVTRVIFHAKWDRYHPTISFMRGQLYNENWIELKNHTIDWQGDRITFPVIFNIPAPYKTGGLFYGPEDPRITIEEDMNDAEPVVVFNMMSSIEHQTRTMHVFRPFTNYSTILTINGQEVRADMEKNWAPFFYNSESLRPDQHKWPSKTIHFIYSFKPLRILQCQLFNGYCDWAYEQDVPDSFIGAHNDTLGRMSGGTNLVRIPVDSAPGTMAYIGFPRSHINTGAACREGHFYRPEMMIMTASSKAHFHLSFVSDSIDFGRAVLSPEAIENPCGEGRILIANSVVKWDQTSRVDIVTITLTVDDSTVQVVRVRGVLGYLNNIPFFRKSLQHDVKEGGEALWDLRWSAVGGDVLSCSVEAAQNYSIALAAPVNSTDIQATPIMPAEEEEP